MRTNHKILNIAKSRLATFSVAILFNVSLAAAVCGTFAWYTYATRTGLEKQYHGTTVGDMGSLQAGLVSEKKLDDYLVYDLAEDDRTLADEGKYIYWCKETIAARTINFVLNENGYATTEMFPVTSSAFDYENDDRDSFTLYRNPTYLVNYDKEDPDFLASKSDYSVLDFVFRYEDVDNIGDYLSGYNVFLSQCRVESAQEEHELYKSVRIYYNNGYEGCIINPTADVSGYNDVGGVLDLNADGFYDYDESEFYEVIYGETEEYEYNAEETSEDGHLNWTQTDTFVANHRKGVLAINEDSFEPKTVKYCDVERFTSKSKRITYTDETYHNLGRFKMYLYFEGWDRHVVNKEQGFGYNLDLAFAVQM